MRIGYDRLKTEEYEDKFGAIILAAGLSSRMKDFKPLLPVDGMPAIVGLIESARVAGISDITVVTGHNREKLLPILKRYGAREAYNENYRDGMMTSVKAGLAKAAGLGADSGSTSDSENAGSTAMPVSVSSSENTESIAIPGRVEKASGSGKSGYLLMPVDCPLISVSVLRKVMSAVVTGQGAVSEEADDVLAKIDNVQVSGQNSVANSEAAGECVTNHNNAEQFAVATFEGKKGHPLYVPAAHIEEILAYDGDGGLAGITDKYADSMIRIETGEEGCVLDMDTPEGYADIKKFVDKGFAREKLELLTARKKIFLVRHGATEQHAEPMFIGQYDVKLSEDGRIAARAAGEQIAVYMAEDVEAEMLGMDKFGKEPMPAIERIYSSDLARARETAEIIKDVVNCGLRGVTGADGVAGVDSMVAGEDNVAINSASIADTASATGQAATADINTNATDINTNAAGPVEVRYTAGLREINLGVWDGRPIREIRKEYPEEYERRGRDLFAFKMRGMESFYDMQYRVLAAFREILRNDDAKDIIIVAHSGVIRVLENNIRGLHVDDEWEPLAKGNFRILEPFPEQPSEKVNNKEKPMNMNDMIMDSVLEYYE